MAPRARSKFGAPMFEPELFLKQICCIKESTCDTVGTFRRPPAVIRRPRNSGPLPPSLRPWVPLGYVYPRVRNSWFKNLKQMVAYLHWRTSTSILECVITYVCSPELQRKTQPSSVATTNISPSAVLCLSSIQKTSWPWTWLVDAQIAAFDLVLSSNFAFSLLYWTAS